MWVLGEPDDEGLSDLLQRQTPGWGIYLYPANRLAVELQTRLGGQEGELAEQAVSLAEADIGHLKDLALEAPIIRLVNDMITEGVEMGASDIHIEPFKHQIELRYRVDGVLHTRQGPRLEDYAAVVSRIKILAELDIAERRVPQDGRIRTRAAGREGGYPGQHDPGASRRGCGAATAGPARPVADTGVNASFRRGWWQDCAPVW
jgi:general secretion pathway protein E